MDVLDLKSLLNRRRPICANIILLPCHTRAGETKINHGVARPHKKKKLKRNSNNVTIIVGKKSDRCFLSTNNNDNNNVGARILDIL